MSSAQEQALGAVPPQGSRVEVAQVAQVAQVAGSSGDGAGAASLAGASKGDPDGSSGAAGFDGWSGFDSASPAGTSAGDPDGSSGATFDTRSDLSDGPEPSGPTNPSEPSELSAASAELPHPRPAPPPADTDQTGRSLPLLARVLLADFGVAIVALIALTVIEVQRMGEPSMSLRRQAYAEDLVVLFVVAVVFGLVALVLLRTRHTRVGLVQAVVTALVLGVAITSAATGAPKPIPVEDVDH